MDSRSKATIVITNGAYTFATAVGDVEAAAAWVAGREAHRIQMRRPLPSMVCQAGRGRGARRSTTPARRCVPGLGAPKGPGDTGAPWG